MIDLHCHILPGLDDGARDLDDSLAMASQAERDGIAAVCATPHIRHDHNVRIEEIVARVDSLQAHLTPEGIGVRVLPGGELAQTQADDLSDTQLRAVALGGDGGSRGEARGAGGGWIPAGAGSRTARRWPERSGAATRSAGTQNDRRPSRASRRR